MPKTIRQLLSLFSPRERLKLAGVLLAMLVMGLTQMVGVGVILPFIALVTNPAAVHHNAFLNWLYTLLGFASPHGFLMFIGGVLLFVLVANNAITAATIWVMTQFSWGVQKDVSERLLDTYIHQPYTAFLNRNVAEIGKNILIESQQFAGSLLLPMLRAVAFGVTAVMIIAFLFWLQPLIASAIVLLFGGAYLTTYLVIRRILMRKGLERIRANTERFQVVNEAFGTVKEVKILNRERHFVSQYGPAAATYARATTYEQVLGALPRYIIEGLAFAAVMAGVLVVLGRGSNLVSVLPLAGAFVVGGYRLLPALQNVYQGFTQVRFNQSVLDTLNKDLNGTVAQYRPDTQTTDAGSAFATVSGQVDGAGLEFESTLELRNVSYQYPGAQGASLDNVSITIRRNTFVALTGVTGAGKTTLADIILGLLEPGAGEIRLDDTPLTERNRSQWQAKLGYVPQEIYLTDSTISRNIAFGLSDEDIDHAAVERAARIANIHDFITAKLPAGYDTVVGDRGVRLSGGQRQRIGIARALYRDPSVIVLDEATSALDNETERRIVDELDAMRGGRTLIVIAHRLTTVQRCHEVFLLDEGRIAAHGTFDDLVQRNDRFRHLYNSGRTEEPVVRAHEERRDSA